MNRLTSHQVTETAAKLFAVHCPLIIAKAKLSQ